MDIKELEDIATRLLVAGSTDVFLRAGDVPRHRLDGEIDVSDDDIVPQETLAAFWQACGADPDTTAERDARYAVADKGFLRVNLYRSMGRLAAAIRPIRDDIPLMQELGLPVELLREWSMRSSGIILVTGPTGSGKSTTVASCLDDINCRVARHIVTVEDPVEYLFKDDLSYFSQREVGSDTPDFANALRASLRQNPDIIFIGEIRDEETARIALRAAETGHLVISTLHSSGVVETMERLRNLFPSDERDSSLQLLATELIGVISQQLLPAISGGLQLAFECLQNEGAVRKWIREADYASLAEFLRRDDSRHNCSLLKSLINVYQLGWVTEETARQAARNPNDFNRVIRGIS